MSLYGARQLADGMRTVRKNTILIAEDIPEKDYGYRPSPASRSVAETLAHIALLSGFDRIFHEEKRLRSFAAFDFASMVKGAEEEERKPRSKREIVDLLVTKGDEWCRWVEGLSEDLLREEVQMPGGIVKNRLEMPLGTKEHELQHRAQLTVLERLLGIVPHLIKNRQTRREAVSESAS